jgi:lysylphosphatidylglycerol synthetase-like protein (DUF2156 family)
MADAGAEFMTLGLTPLAQVEVHLENPRWVQILFAWARAHGRRFYNFEGLEAFKRKFRPHGWEPIYIISREARFSLSSLVAVAGAFTGRHLMQSAAAAATRAIAHEARLLKRRAASALRGAD